MKFSVNRPVSGLLGGVCLLVLGIAVMPPDAQSQPQPHETWLVSRASGVDGDVAIGTVSGPVAPPGEVSDNGRFVVFAAGSDNIHPDVTDFSAQVYVRDLQTHDTHLASRVSGANGDPAAGGGAGIPSISGDGRFVVFISGASNLHPDGEFGANIYVRDMQAQVTSLVSRADGVDGLPADDVWWGWSRISANGRFVVFVSEATHLHPDVTQPELHVYVRDLQAHTTTLISRASGINGAIADAPSEGFFNISADGRYVAFQSSAGNLDSAADGSTSQIFMRDLQNHQTFLVSRADGADGAAADILSGDDEANYPVGISADGSLVVFSALASNLHPDADGLSHQIYMRDVQAHTTALVSRAEGMAGAIGNSHSALPEISGNGRFVTFISDATNLHPDMGGVPQVVVRDLQTHEIWLQSRASGADGMPGNAVSFYPSLSADGQVLAFISQANNLHPDFSGTDLAHHIYARGVAPDGGCSDCPATPPLPAPDPGFEPDADSSRIGAMAGEFQVDESGAANYGIPIMTVPGSGGVAPEVALSYNSHQGRGPLGTGWSLSGLSTISRCGQTLEQDGRTTGVKLTSGDRFCLDGQRLMLVSQHEYGDDGSEYRLEIDDFTRVKAHGQMDGGGPEYFTVERKDGSVSTYGNGDAGHSARVEAANGAGDAVVFAWPISRFQDSADNFIDYQYFQPGGDWIEWLPEAIHYTGNLTAGTAPYANIEFVHAGLNASSRTTSYVAGQQMRTTQRLARINSYGEDEQLIRQYRLGYGQDSFGRDFLESVRECWSEDDDDCLPPTTFAWQTGQLEIPESQRQKDVSRIGGFQTALAGDLTGNGRQEVVYMFQDDSQTYFSVLVNRGTNFFDWRATTPVVAGCSIKAKNVDAIALIDLEGDGYQGLVYAATDCQSLSHNGIYYHPWVHGDPGGLGPAERIGGVADFSGIEDVKWDQVRLSTVDWDGDGLADLVLSNRFSCSGCSEPGQVDYLYRNDFPSTQALELPLSRYPTWGRDALNFPERYEGCEVVGIRGERTLDAPVVDIDGSGKGGVMMRARIFLKNCPASTLQKFDGPDWIQLEDEEIGYDGDEVGVSAEVVRAVFQYGLVEVDGKQELHAINAVPFEGAGWLSGENYLPTDVNADGLTDFLMLVDARENHQRNVYLYINNGNIYEHTGTPLFQIREEVAANARTFDYTGNGHPDFLVPSDSGDGDAQWRIHRWQPTPEGGSFDPVSIAGPAAGNIKAGSWSVFADLFGNGIQDIASFFPNAGWNDCNLSPGGSGYCLYASTGRTSSVGQPRYTALNRITHITDGLGARTDIEYKSLAQRSVYTRDNNGPYSGYGNGAVIYDVVPPTYVVSAAESLAPQVVEGTFDSAATTRVEYYYTGAKLQAGGRGMLGFGEVASFDVQSGMLTRTRYRQDFPYIGVPKETHSWYHPPGSEPWPREDNLPDVQPCNAPAFPGEPPPLCENPAVEAGILLGKTRNIWDQLPTSGSVYHPYLADSRESSYTPEYENGVLTDSQFTHRVVTTVGNLDDYGNPRLVDVATYTSPSGTDDLVSRQTTVNEYDNDPAAWHLGRLICAEVTSERPGQATELRRSTFGYDLDTGILTRETVQAEGCTGPDGLLTTAYDLDDFGNRISTTVTSDNLLRESTQSYDSLGRFVEARAVLIDSAPQTTETVLARDHYGNPTEVENGQGVITYHYYGFMGRPHYSYTPDGAWSRTLYSLDTTDCPAGTAFKELQSAADGSVSEVCHDVLGRESRTRAQSFDGTWVHADTHYDYASRVVAASEPYFHVPDEPKPSGEPTIYWTTTDYDELGRVEFVTHPDTSTESWTYDGLTTTHTNVLNQPHTVTTNALGEKVEEIAEDGMEQAITTYGYDTLGQLIWTDGPLAGDADRIDIEYDVLGHKTRMVDPDKGEWHYRHNALGELVCQQDAEGQGVSMEYDELGRLVRRSDLPNITDLDTCAGGSAVGSSSWTYGNTSGEKEFGQVVKEDAYYLRGGSIHPKRDQTTRDYTHDTLGRVSEITTTIAGADGFEREYIERTTYDQYGREFQQFDASNHDDPDGDQGIRYLYNGFGYLEALREAQEGVQGLVYWQVETQDERGNVTEALLGNGVLANAGYDAATGRLLNLQAVNNTDAIAAQDLELWWDALGNLTCRRDHSDQAAVLSEKFGYDARNRLEWSAYLPCESEDPAPQDQNMSMGYDLAGNITTKSGVGSYTYDVNNRPHAVTNAGGRTFQYDNNGNVTSDGERSFAYTTFDKLHWVSTGSGHTEFGYGPGREKALKYDIQGTTVQSRTHYVGNVEIVWDGASPGQNAGEYRRYIGGVALVTFDEQDGATEARYLHKDHLGSVTAITDQDGAIVARMAYDPWGQRRHPGDLNQPWDQWAQPSPPNWGPLADAMLDLNRRGYTDHEQVDSHGIVHMRGRIYDPHLGRFLQADPFVEDSTTLNRYTYVHNNPLAYTDPSGYFSWKKTFRQVAGLALTIASIAYGDSVGGWTGFWTMTTGSFVGGYLATGTVRGAFTSSALAGTTGGVLEFRRRGASATESAGEGSTGTATDPSDAAVGIAAGKTLPQPLTVGQRAGNETELGDAISDGELSLPPAGGCGPLLCMGSMGFALAAGGSGHALGTYDEGPRQRAREEYARQVAREAAREAAPRVAMMVDAGTVIFPLAGCVVESCSRGDFALRAAATLPAFRSLRVTRGVRPANMSPSGAGRSGAFNEAKRQAGIPTSQQPSRILPNVNRRGNPQPGRIYEYEVPAPGGGTRTVRIRDDAGGHNFGPGNPQNRGRHFNDEAGRHYDY